MELTPDKLAVLQSLADLMHRKNSAELARHIQARRALEAELEDARARAGVTMTGSSEDTVADLAAARQWAASSAPVTRALLARVPGLETDIAQARDKTRQSLARSEACEAIGEALDDEARKAAMRREDRAYRPSAGAVNPTPRR